MICPTCKAEGNKSVVTLWGQVQMSSGLVQWDENGKRIQPPPRRMTYGCSRGHRWHQ